MICEVIYLYHFTGKCALIEVDLNKSKKKKLSGEVIGTVRPGQKHIAINSQVKVFVFLSSIFVLNHNSHLLIWSTQYLSIILLACGTIEASEDKIQCLQKSSQSVSFNACDRTRTHPHTHEVNNECEKSLAWNCTFRRFSEIFLMN